MNLVHPDSLPTRRQDWTGLVESKRFDRYGLIAKRTMLLNFWLHRHRVENLHQRSALVFLLPPRSLWLWMEKQNVQRPRRCHLPH